MLPEVKKLLESNFISYVVFDVDPDYTTQHIIIPEDRFHEYPAFNNLSNAVKNEIYNLRIVQEPAYFDDLEMPKVYFRLRINDETVASQICPPLDELPYITVMMGFRISLLLNRTNELDGPKNPSIQRYLSSLSR